MCEKAEILLIYLPVYLYDFNPIKTSFVFLKSYIRRYSRLADVCIFKNGGF